MRSTVDVQDRQLSIRSETAGCGCVAFALASSQAAELIAPQHTATISPKNCLIWLSISASTESTAVPVALVTRRVTLASVISVTLGKCMISRMQLTSESAAPI
jgi:hypothetical protein